MNLDCVYNKAKAENKPLQEVVVERFEVRPLLSPLFFYFVLTAIPYKLGSIQSMEESRMEEKKLKSQWSTLDEEPKQPTIPSNADAPARSPVMTTNELNKLMSEAIKLELASKKEEARAAESRHAKEKRKYDEAMSMNTRSSKSRESVSIQRFISQKSFSSKLAT